MGIPNFNLIQIVHMNQRYYSLDVFRGATVALMILVNNPGSWEHIFAPLEHAPWHGCTPTDLVFPFFLFAVGNAMAFVMPRFKTAGTAVFLQKVLKRTVLIFAIGLFLNWSPFIMWQQNMLVPKTWLWTDGEGLIHGIRILGVLQRIALCYCFAALLVYFLSPQKAAIAGLLLLLCYWGLCYYLGNATDPYSLTGYFGTGIDKAILGDVHMYHGEGLAFDPEGLGSLLPAIVQVMIGFFVGNFILVQGKTATMLKQLFISGIVFIVVGLVWSLVFPLNKKIWTSSYVLYTSGLAIAILGLLIYMIEFKQLTGKLTRFFDVFGKNPLFIFVLSGFLPRVLALIRIKNGITPAGQPQYLTPFGWFYEHICKNISADLRVGSLAYAIFMISFYWLIVYLLDRKKIYIRV